MAFHSWQYGLLLIASLLFYWLCAERRALRTWLLVVASLWYYGAFELWFLWLLVFSIVLDYIVGLRIQGARTPRGRMLALLCSLFGNLGLLAYFKYSLWIAELLQPVQEMLGTNLPLEALAWNELSAEGKVLVPAGISFYTFQSLSYTIDVYRGVIKPLKSLRDFGFFVSFFPQLVAGPIVRAKDFLPQMELKPRLDRARMHDGLWRIAIGLAKKTLLADTLGRFLVDPVYGHPGDYAPAIHALALYGFWFQIYCDFSGYSDIAIGSARLFGFDLLENFDAPYRALSVREFWRRWHISLSSWVRDYLYFPLGGSRGSEWKVARNLMITMVVIGLWHGASVLWLLYGISQGIGLIVDRWLLRLRGEKLFATTHARILLAWAVTFVFSSGTAILIRARDWDNVVDMFSTFGASSEIAPVAYAALGAAVLTHFLPDRWVEAVKLRLVSLPSVALGLLLGLLCGTLFMIIQGKTAFIYFGF